MEKESSKEKKNKLDPKKREIILTVVVLLIAIVVGIIVGKILYEAMNGAI